MNTVPYGVEEESIPEYMVKVNLRHAKQRILEAKEAHTKAIDDFWNAVTEASEILSDEEFETTMHEVGIQL